MKTKITASRTIDADAGKIYKIIADYHTGHPRILPPAYFPSLHVETGGLGAGTLLHFEMRLFGQTQTFRSRITEPEPGHILQETELNSGSVTSFVVSPLESGKRANVTISTELSGRNFVESFLLKGMLPKIYQQELDLLARVAAQDASLNQPLSTPTSPG